MEPEAREKTFGSITQTPDVVHFKDGAVSPPIAVVPDLTEVPSLPSVQFDEVADLGHPGRENPDLGDQVVLVDLAYRLSIHPVLELEELGPVVCLDTPPQALSDERAQ